MYSFGEGVADYEGCYLPDGEIIFNSTRCMQIVDCWWTEVSNLYRCDAEGKNIRRLTRDQVHLNYPAVSWDGRILYTRWEYVDRPACPIQSLWAIRPDGTGLGLFMAKKVILAQGGSIIFEKRRPAILSSESQRQNCLAISSPKNFESE